MTTQSSLLTKLALPSSLLLATLALFESTNLDLWIQDHFYDFNTHHWLVDRSAFWPNLVFYDGAKNLIILLVLSIVIVLLLFRKRPLIQRYQRRLWLVVLAAITIPLLIGSLKATTNIPCPRDIERYGGSYPHVTLLHRYADTYHPAEKQRCYPAGHASGGFALLALAFLFTAYRTRALVLFGVVTVATTMGVYKMLIGDHFLSHTLVTALIAWIMVLGLAHLLNIDT